MKQRSSSRNWPGKNIKVVKDRHFGWRHYSYGCWCGAYDGDLHETLDGMMSIDMYETYQGLPVGMVEYKFGGASFDMKSDQFYNMAYLARLRNKTLPAWINCYYYTKKDGSPYESWDDQDDPNMPQMAHAQHIIISVNKKAVELLGHKYRYMTEVQYVRWLYEKIRGIPYPEKWLKENEELCDTADWTNVKLPTVRNLNHTYED
jgi:hypothetical protein